MWMYNIKDFQIKYLCGCTILNIFKLTIYVHVLYNILTYYHKQ